MKSRKNGFPLSVEIMVNDEKAVVLVRENISESKEEQGIFEYDEYRIETYYREGLSDDIERNFEKWLSFAKDKEKDGLAKSVREERNRLLNESDWRMCADSPMSEEERERWGEYRQMLRDITDSDGFPYSVSFPEAPDDK